MPGSFLCLPRYGCPPAVLRIGCSPPFPLLPALLVPRQSTPHSLIPRLGTPSSASYSTWMLGCPVPHTIRLLAARSSGMLPLAGSTPPDAPDDLPFADPAPLRLLLKKSIPLQAVPCTIREYMALYQTLLYSLASRILVQDTRRFDAYGHFIAIFYSSLKRTTGHCLIFFPTFLRSNANTISLDRSKKPSPRCQLMPHLQCFRPMNCCFIFLPQFGQILPPLPFFFCVDGELGGGCGLSGSPPS